MATFKVNAEKLNLRRSPVKDFADKANVVGVLHKDALFESVGRFENELGGWHVGADGNCVSENWLGEFKSVGIFEGQRTFRWFEDLKIAKIWEKYSERGALSTIAILDTGYNINNIEIEESIDKSCIVIDTGHYAKEKLIIDDRSTIGHGTRCVSLVGCQNRAGFIVGIAPESKLLVGKISINREVRDFEYILKGIEWSIKEGADIISISYACDFTESELALYSNKFEQVANNNNVLIFAASGNSDVPIQGERYPASFTGCISVGSTDAAGAISSFTISSHKTILHAIGNDIESYGKSSIPDMQSGTSYSTPIVSGIAALAVSYLKRNGKKINLKDLLQKLIQTADPISNKENKRVINIEKLFENL